MSARTESRYQRWVGVGVILGAASLMGVAALQHMVAMSTTTGVLVFAFLPFLINLGVVAYGIGLWYSGLSDGAVLRIAGWMLVGMAALGLMATWTISHQNIRGRPFAHGLFVTVNNLSAGAFIGLLIGWYEAGVRRYKQEVATKHAELQRQINQLDRFATVLSHDPRNPSTWPRGTLSSPELTAAATDSRPSHPRSTG